MMKVSKKKLLVPWVSALAFLLLLLSPETAQAQQAVVPGRSVGRVFLGMQQSDVRKILQSPRLSRSLPASALPAPHRPGRYTVDQWESGTHLLTILYRNAQVVQIEVDSPQFTAPGGVSVDAPLATVRRRFPKMRVDQYIATVQGEEDSGERFFCADDVRRGIAFTQYPDTATYDDLPSLTPDTLIVHLPGQRALPVPADPQDIVKPNLRRDDFLFKTRNWFAGSPLHKITKGSR